MLFNYRAIDSKGGAKEGSIDAVNVDVAISALQRRGFVISSIKPAKKKSILELTVFENVSMREVVLLSRQIATLFKAQVSALRIFRLLAAEAPSSVLQEKLIRIADDLQGGSTIADALGKHKKVFSSFYVNMVRVGEETGKLSEIFLHLADYLERTYEVTSKARNALIYPAFVVFTFVTVMILMFTLVIPRINEILLDVGGELPFLTRIIIGISNFLIDYGPFFIILLTVAGFFAWRYSKTERGIFTFAQLQLEIPAIGTLYRKLYLSRFADNLNTMLSSGIPMVRVLEITSTTIGNSVYEKHLLMALADVKGGRALSDALSDYPEFPGILTQMIRVGEETGELGNILETMAAFYRREVESSIDTIVNLIEPIMIVALGLGVGILLSAILLPIYNISSAI